MDTKTEKPIRIYPIEWVCGVALMGGICVFALFGNIWNDDGLITGWFSFPRLLTVVAAVALGLVIGWMVFPRVPTDAIRPVLGDPDVDPKDTMTWASRREGVAPDGTLWPGSGGRVETDLSGTDRTMERDQTRPDTLDDTGPANR